MDPQGNASENAYQPRKRRAIHFLSSLVELDRQLEYTLDRFAAQGSEYLTAGNTVCSTVRVSIPTLSQYHGFLSM